MMIKMNCFEALNNKDENQLLNFDFSKSHIEVPQMSLQELPLDTFRLTDS